MPNRLANATSPYLLQHADNPVDWWEWGPAALEEARRRDVVPPLDTVSGASCITLVHHFAPIAGDPVTADLDVFGDLTGREDMFSFTADS